MRPNGSLIKIEQAQHARPGAKNVITVASANGKYNSEEYMPNTPKKPPNPRATSSHLTCFLPSGQSGVELYHMYVIDKTTVMLMRAKRI
ncbi:hypothetical protein Tdes44962_MAKER05398 [Teratosphaeria destructans]|uniref:Uncharacterized protein n=1 Tax=Teratosphaeria destructans TaxID=418781 RepID=A0A9W7VYX6_9PEZI|nr:hypothetical protein Tdes44962_MAKER05398 [Teratosphaeria destructans]